MCHKVFQDQYSRNSHMESCSRRPSRGSGRASGKQTHFAGYELRNHHIDHSRRRGGQRGGQRGRRGGQRGGQKGGKGGSYRGSSRQESQHPYCWICDREMDSDEGFMAHYQSQVHIDACVAYRLNCQACETAFGNEFGIQLHMLQHHQNSANRRSR